MTLTMDAAGYTLVTTSPTGSSTETGTVLSHDPAAKHLLVRVVTNVTDYGVAQTNHVAGDTFYGLYAVSGNSLQLAFSFTPPYPTDFGFGLTLTRQ